MCASNAYILYIYRNRYTIRFGALKKLLTPTILLYRMSKEVSGFTSAQTARHQMQRCSCGDRLTDCAPPSPMPSLPAEASFGSVDPTSLWWPGRNGDGVRHLHHREAFASKVDGVLAMRLTCEEEGGGRGCLRRVFAYRLLL